MLTRSAARILTAAGAEAVSPKVLAGAASMGARTVGPYQGRAVSTTTLSLPPEFPDIELGVRTDAATRRYADPNAVCVVSGASRGIGLALATRWLELAAGSVVCLGRNVADSAGIATLASKFPSRVSAVPIDLTDPSSVAAAVAAVDHHSKGRVDVLINVAGLLGNGKSDPGPERTARRIDPAWLRRSFETNLFGHVQLTGGLFESGSLKVGKRAADLAVRPPAVVGSITARVGSIGDNRLGGWYSYRMSKAALNMFTKTFALEAARDNCFPISLHPGTVDTGLSEPFQRGVPENKLFTVEFSATRMLAVLDAIDADRAGGFFDWDGKAIPW